MSLLREISGKASGFDFSFRIDGVEETMEGFSGITVQAGKDAQIALNTIGIRIAANARRRAPILRGNLRESVYVVSPSTPNLFDQPNWRGPKNMVDRLRQTRKPVVNRAMRDMRRLKSPAVEIGFSAFYAVHVHEGLGPHKSRGPRQFLTDAAKEEARRMAKEVATQIRKGL